MAGLTNYSEKYLLDLLFASNVYAELHTGDPGEDALDNKVSTAEDASYTRKVLTIGPATQGTGKALNTTAFSWTVGSSSGFTITHISLWDAITGGNAVFKGELLAPEVMAANDVYSIAIGQLIVQLD